MNKPTKVVISVAGFRLPELVMAHLRAAGTDPDALAYADDQLLRADPLLVAAVEAATATPRGAGSLYVVEVPAHWESWRIYSFDGQEIVVDPTHVLGEDDYYVPRWAEEPVKREPEVQP